MTPETVHLVFKTHLDIGFTDHAAAVRRLYHDRFIPQAIATAEHFWLEDPDNPKFIWTTGAWLIHDHLETGTPEQVDRLESAIARGLIRWHGLPYTTHSELMSPALFRAGLSYSHELDARFGMTTRAAKMTDVPGHTLGIVPLMAEAGLRFLHIGVNGASPVPDLPDVFRWQAPDGSEIVVMYQDDYGKTHLPDGMKDALSFAHTHDNIGPQSVSQAVDVWREMEHALPGSRIRAATLESYADLLWERRADLPVVTHEIGDSWIHGAGSDPLKLARFRNLQRLYDAFEAEGLTDARLAFGRGLGMVAEHTWGVDIKTYLRDDRAFDRPAFDAARASDNRFRFTEASWEEQRAYLDTAVAALDEEDRRRADRADATLAAPPAITAPASTAAIGGYAVDIDKDSGDILGLHTPDGRALGGEPLIAYRHLSYDHADLSRHLDSYLTNRPEWAILDHDKPGLAQAKTARSASIRPIFRGLFADDTALEVHCDMPEEATRTIGAPARVTYRLSPLQGGLEIGLKLEGKPANRMPEAGFLTFDPKMAAAWSLLKTGLWVDPAACAHRGGGALHAAFAAKTHVAGTGLRLDFADSALVAPAHRDFMTFETDPPAWYGGIDICLYTNKWGTNFPMWWEGDLWSRVHLHLV